MKRKRAGAKTYGRKKKRKIDLFDSIMVNEEIPKLDEVTKKKTKKLDRAKI